jgi:ribosomal protein S18 acetylase RimI-like enzyme
MATIEADAPPSGDAGRLVDLTVVRRFEAAGFRAWPAQCVSYDGTWAVRLTAGHPAKRLNSINPLDPADIGRLEERIERLGRTFAAYGRTLTFRLSPLAGEELSRYFDREGWSTFGESVVMRLDLDKSAVAESIDQIPLKDVGRFVSAAIGLRSGDPGLHEGLASVIGSIRAQTGLFLHESDCQPVASAICVQDNRLAGLFEVATTAMHRRQGHARRLVLSALKWAWQQGATQAWLQVEADNLAALALYESIGFREIYRYHYRRPAEPANG